MLVAIAVPAVTKEKTLETDALAPNKFSSQSVIPSLSSSKSVESGTLSPSESLPNVCVPPTDIVHVLEPLLKLKFDVESAPTVSVLPATAEVFISAVIQIYQVFPSPK